MLCSGVAACHRYGVCTVVWQHVIGMVCVVCCVYCGMAACHRYGVYTVVWQHVIGMVCVLWYESMS